MHVVRVQARCLKIPIKFPFTDTPRTEGMLVVQVETDDGLVGAGISRDAERFAAIIKVCSNGSETHGSLG